MSTPIFDELITELGDPTDGEIVMPIPSFDQPWIRDDSVMLAAGHQSPAMFAAADAD